MYKFSLKGLDLVISITVFIVFFPVYLIVFCVLYLINDGKAFFLSGTELERIIKIFKLLKFK